MKIATPTPDSKIVSPHFHTVQALLMVLLFCSAIVSSRAATVVLYTNDFESYTNVATTLADTSDADPYGVEWNISDDNGLNPTTAGAGVQVISHQSHTGSKSLFLRAGTEAQIYIPALGGTNYVLDFWVWANRPSGADRNWYVLVRGMGNDNNGDDMLAYRTERLTNNPNILYFDGIGAGNAFIDTGADYAESTWQHHRIVFDMISQKCDIYVDDMVTPVVTGGDLARPDTTVPSLIILRNEGNSADDGYAAFDDLSVTVTGNLLSLSNTFTEGFETYAARTNATDDADPGQPWLITESLGAGAARQLDQSKVQVVDSSVVAPHSGSKCLKLEGGQRAGATVAWGIPPQSDVQITWWARVPSAVPVFTADAVVARMSLYGYEGISTYSGDCALLGYGIRNVPPPLGDATSLLYFTTAWQDTTNDFTPDTWEEYQLTTHNSQGAYTIIKNPSSANPILLVDRAGFIGSAGSWGPNFMAAWSSSNGTNHPPVYIDDITIRSLVSNPTPLPTPYTVTNYGTRFTNFTIVKVTGGVGKAVVDPRDNTTIIFALDGAPGGIYRAQKIASGNWAVDPTPIVNGIDRPSGLVVDGEGTIWWTHDFTMSLRRLKAPWNLNSVEEVISNFGDPLGAVTDDDPIDVAIAPSTFNGSPGQPNMIVVADRGVDGDANNTIYLVSPGETNLNQVTYTNYLVTPSASTLGGGNLNCIAPLVTYGEVVTVSQDGKISAVDANGSVRDIVPAVLWQDFFSGGPAPTATGVATDPQTGRLWIADDIRDQVWSLDPNPATASAAPDQKELAFFLTDTNRPDLQIDMHDPTLAFATNGAFMVLTDTSTANGGGRLLIFHNEPNVIPPFSITSAVRAGQSFQLTWASAGSVTYNVERSTNGFVSFQTIVTNLTTTQFTDTNMVGQAFYRVKAQP